MKFEDLKFKSHPNHEGIQALVYFNNGFGASIIKTPYSYGGENGRYELAVMKNGSVCYNSGITDDVLGYLTKEDVGKYLADIESLKKVENDG